MRRASAILNSRKRFVFPGVPRNECLEWREPFNGIGASNIFTYSGLSVVASGFRNACKNDLFLHTGINRHILANHGTVSQQARGFLGCGDGDEDSGLAKTYEEKRVIGYSPEQLFAVVAAVDLYEDFVPWCQRSTILQWKSDEAFEAELEIGFKFLVEKYISHVELKKPNYVKTTSTESNLFDHLINIWEFNNGPVSGTCDLHFFVDFQFRSPLYRQVANMFFKEVVSCLVQSFEQRCETVYGPAVKILETVYESQ